jgi:hypothetical protein
VWINHDHDLLDLTIRTKTGHTATLHTTANHPFWDDTTHAWAPAGKLRAGEALNTATNQHVYVVSTHPTSGTANRWNLTVQQLHTYYVVAGGTTVLVHNTCGEIPYNSNKLSNAAYNARVGAGVGSGRNVAVARVPGWNDPKTGDLVIGFSKGNGYHSENHILDQMAAKGFDPEQITELYSERQPCPVCGPMLDGALSPGTPISWSVPWGSDATLNAASNELLRQMIAAAGGR